MTAYIARIAFATLFTGTAMAAGLAHAEPTPASDPQLTAAPQAAPPGRQAPFGYAVAGGASRTITCLLYTSPSPRDRQKSRMPSSA